MLQKQIGWRTDTGAKQRVQHRFVNATVTEAPLHIYRCRSTSILELEATNGLEAPPRLVEDQIEGYTSWTEVLSSETL